MASTTMASRTKIVKKLICQYCHDYEPSGTPATQAATLATHEKACKKYGGIIKGNKCLKCGYQSVQSTTEGNRRTNLRHHVRTKHPNELKVSFLYKLNLFL